MPRFREPNLADTPPDPYPFQVLCPIPGSPRSSGPGREGLALREPPDGSETQEPRWR